jgi:LssY C-terminus
MLKGLGAALTFVGVALCSVQGDAAVLPAGTNLEARLSTATGSRISHPGDRVEATVIAPVYSNERIVVPQGAVISGVVESVDRLGLGIKHPTAGINFRFTSLRLPDGTTSDLEARTAEVETARERVAPDGDIRGIHANASLSSGASILISALIADVHFAIPAIGMKFLIARSPDPEIYFPAGTELILQTTADASVTDIHPLEEAAELDTRDERRAQDLLSTLPEQTFIGRNRPSDLVNILLLGTHEQIERAFRAAGWTGEQRHSALALYRMYHCLVQRTGYKMAPMARLRFNGQVPDTVYQKSLDTFSKRHHIRLWQQDGSDAWVGATTQDVAYTFRRMHLTHASDDAIDNERTKVVNDLWMTGCVSRASVMRRELSRQYESSGFPISTDGGVAILRLNNCPEELPGGMMATQAPTYIRPGFRQAFVAIGNDLIHSNPATLAYTIAKSIVASPLQGGYSFRTASPRAGHSKSGFGETGARLRWRRPSVTGPELAAPPALTAEILR